MARVTPFVRFGAAAAWLCVGVAAADATEMPAYAPVQTESEIAFVSSTLGLKERIATLQQQATEVMQLDYAMLDLDADGSNELFIRIRGGDACAPGSCTTLVYNKSSGAWVKVLETDEAEVTVAKQAHRGYRDIMVGSQPWLWTGKAYAPVR